MAVCRMECLVGRGEKSSLISQSKTAALDPEAVISDHQIGRRLPPKFAMRSSGVRIGPAHGRKSLTTRLARSSNRAAVRDQMPHEAAIIM